ncbi:MAG: hypothetical protein LAO06_18300 [Acidobacteriia bacterium]|nr:hypothetical protein [Terriglobia bacterium]
MLKTIRGYILWTYERGSMQYDVMVTLILAFIFVAPYWVNFKDKPIERTPHQTEVIVFPDGQSGFIYQVDASVVHGSDPASIETDLLRTIEPIAGEVDITKYEPVRDARGRVVGYKVWVSR